MMTTAPTTADRQPSVDREPAAGTVAIVHPRLSTAAAGGMWSAGFTRVAVTGAYEVWVRYPAP